MRLGVLASHGGSTMQAVIDAISAGKLAAEITTVVSNNSSSQALQRARAAKIATAHLSSATHPAPAELDAAVSSTLQAAQVELVVLCGYMKKLGPKTLQTFQGRIVNTHPSLLPKYGGRGFYGRKVHEAVLASGDRIAGATVHEVNGIYDSGKVLAQVEVPVHHNDSVEDLEDRVKAAERELLVTTLARIVESRGEL